MKQRKLKKVPTFSSEDAERSFWATHDSAEYVGWQNAERRSLPNLKPTLRTISQLRRGRSAEPSRRGKAR